MLLIPFFLRRLGVKWMLLIGMLAWVVRFSLFAGAAVDGVYSMILLGILVHGICYDFFFVTGQIYIDKKTSGDIRGQAQGLLVFVTYGLGLLIGTSLSGLWVNSLAERGPLTLDTVGLASVLGCLCRSHSGVFHLFLFYV